MLFGSVEMHLFSLSFTRSHTHWRTHAHTHLLPLGVYCIGVSSTRCQKVGARMKSEQQRFKIFTNFYFCPASLSLSHSLSHSRSHSFSLSHSLSLFHALSLILSSTASLSHPLSVKTELFIGLACLIVAGILFIPWPIASSFFNSLSLSLFHVRCRTFLLFSNRSILSQRERERERERDREREKKLRLLSLNRNIAT